MGELSDYIALGFVVVLIVGLLFIGYPIYNVWASEQGGKAELARADYSKRVAVVEAQAKLDSAGLLADAEVKRAEGVAKANQIIGESLKGHTEYLQYLWITQLEKSTHETIYVPTEAQIPILEAGKNVR
jgi:hypothetical protein